MLILCITKMSNIFNVLNEYFVGGIALAVYQIKLRYEAILKEIDYEKLAVNIAGCHCQPAIGPILSIFVQEITAGIYCDSISVF